MLVGVAAVHFDEHEREIAYAVDNDGMISVIEVDISENGERPKTTVISDIGARVGVGDVQIIDYDPAVGKFYVLDSEQQQVTVLE